MGAQDYDTRTRHIVLASMPALASVIESTLSICRLKQTDARTVLLDSLKVFHRAAVNTAASRYAPTDAVERYTSKILL